MKPEKVDFPISVEETRTIERITFKKMLFDIIGAFNFERGLIYTLKLLILRPGELMKQYLYEGRYRIFNPFRLLILSTAISLFAYYFIDIQDMYRDLNDTLESGSNLETYQQRFFELFQDWYNLFIWISIPCYAIFSFIFNRKSSYNFAEHLTFQTFYICYSNVITLLSIPFTLFLKSETIFMGMFLISILAYYFMLQAWLQGKGLGFYFKNTIAYLLAIFLYMMLISVIISSIIIFEMK